MINPDSKKLVISSRVLLKFFIFIKVNYSCINQQPKYMLIWFMHVLSDRPLGLADLFCCYIDTESDPKGGLDRRVEVGALSGVEGGY